MQASRGDGSATVSWDAPADDGGAPILNYTVTTVETGDTQDVIGATLVGVTGLTNGQSYTFTVRAANLRGESAESSASAAVIPG